MANLCPSIRYINDEYREDLEVKFREFVEIPLVEE